MRIISVVAVLLEFQIVSATEAGVRDYTIEDYIAYFFGLLLVVLGIAILLEMAKEK